VRLDESVEPHDMAKLSRRLSVQPVTGLAIHSHFVNTDHVHNFGGSQRGEDQAVEGDRRLSEWGDGILPHAARRNELRRLYGGRLVALRFPEQPAR
jgi:hypothetical protein